MDAKNMKREADGENGTSTTDMSAMRAPPNIPHNRPVGVTPPFVPFATWRQGCVMRKGAVVLRMPSSELRVSAVAAAYEAMIPIGIKLAPLKPCENELRCCVLYRSRRIKRDAGSEFARTCALLRPWVVSSRRPPLLVEVMRAFCRWCT